ncbi:MAG: methylenetetrahydrofolate reductase, partial [Chromatocurvus sp.]
MAATPATESALSRLLQGYSAEVTTPNRKTLDAAAVSMPAGSRVYVASLPKASIDEQIDTARMLADRGLEPVPHIVARNLAGHDVLTELMERLVSECRVRRVLVLGGDRDASIGPFRDAQDLLSTGVIQRAGLDGVSLGCYPEGHSRIPEDTLHHALLEKVGMLKEAGVDVLLVSQFAFDGAAILTFVRKLRESGIRTPLRVGVAGPARMTTLIKYAMVCGVGPSLRVLRDRQSLTRDLLAQQTPREVLEPIALASQLEPELRLWGVHFFTFSALQKSIDWAEAH